METWKLGNPTSADFTNPTSFISVDCKKKKMMNIEDKENV